MNKTDGLKNKFNAIVKKNKEFAGILDDLEKKKDKFEQKNLVLLKNFEEVLLICNKKIKEKNS